MRDAAEALRLGNGDGDDTDAVPLFVEFTGLLTWHGAPVGGANLGWHDDASGGPHLAQVRAPAPPSRLVASTLSRRLACVAARQRGALSQQRGRRFWCDTCCALFLLMHPLTLLGTGGGAFLCEDGSGSRSLAPRAGTLLLYRSTLRHAVEEVTWGRRHTLSMWLTRDGAHDEDAALLGPGAQ